VNYSCGVLDGGQIGDTFVVSRIGFLLELGFCGVLGWGVLLLGLVRLFDFYHLISMCLEIDHIDGWFSLVGSR